MRSYFCRLMLCGVLLWQCAGPVLAADPVATKSAQIGVEAHVPHRSVDLQFDLTSNLTTSAVGADQEIEYTITYGTRLSHPAPLVIEAEWSLGTTDSTLSSIDIVQYVAGSATPDYWGTTVPVVDVKKRKITWTVDRFPRNTLDKTVMFRLKTPGRYVTDRNVNFTVTAKLKTNEVALAPLTLEQVYAPREFILRQVRGMQIMALDVTKITDTAFTFYLLTSVPAKTVVTYGTDRDTLDQTFVDTAVADQKMVTISGLQPGTTYFFKVLIENENGIQRRTPEFLTVTTASSSVSDLINDAGLLFSTQGIILPQGQPSHGLAAIVAQSQAKLNVFIPFKAHVPLLSYISVQPRRVLGTATDDPADGGSEKLRLLETEAGTFTGNVALPAEAGMYEMVLETQTADGMVGADVIGEVTVTRPLTIRDDQGKPIEKALVYFEQYNPLTRKFEYFSAQSFGYRNPTYSNADGTVEMVLPYGEYTMNVNALGYHTYQQRFQFPGAGTEAYPQVTLLRGPFSLTQTVSYYASIWQDFLILMNESADRIAASYRFLDFTLAASLFILSLVSLLLNVHRIKLSFEGLVIFAEKWFSHHISRVPEGKQLFVGFVENDQNGLPVMAATVVLLPEKTNLVSSSDVTRSMGEFHLHVDPNRTYQLAIRKHGFAAIHLTITGKELLQHTQPFRLHPELMFAYPRAVQFAFDMIKALLYGFSDALLVALIILNGVLIVRIGIIRAIPVLVILLLNVIVWVEFQWKRWRLERSVSTAQFSS